MLHCGAKWGIIPLHDHRGNRVLFTGNHTCIIDQKQRLAIPAKFRNLLARELHRSAPPDGAAPNPGTDAGQGRAGAAGGQRASSRAARDGAEGRGTHEVDPTSESALGALEWYCVPWPNGSLRLYTAPDFERLAARRDPALMPASHEAELEADFFGFAEHIESDAAGRITLPFSVLELVGLKKGDDVAVVGAGLRIEVWPAGVYAATRGQRFQRLAIHADSAARTTPHPPSAP